MDGCGPFATFWRVMLPLARPGLAVTAFFTFLTAWGEVAYARRSSRPTTSSPWRTACRQFVPRPLQPAVGATDRRLPCSSRHPRRAWSSSSRSATSSPASPPAGPRDDRRHPTTTRPQLNPPQRRGVRWTKPSGIRHDQGAPPRGHLYNGSSGTFLPVKEGNEAMATVTFDNATRQYPGNPIPSRRQAQHRDRGRGVPRPRRSLRMWQVHLPAHARRPRGGQRRPHPHRRPRRDEPVPQGPRRRDGVPELRALPAHDGRRQHGLRAQDRRRRQGRDPQARRGGRQDPRPRRPTSTASRRPSPVASASASPWAAPSCARRRSSSWTSRCPTSTPSSASRPAPRSPRSSAASASRRSTSRTTRSRP